MKNETDNPKQLKTFVINLSPLNNLSEMTPEIILPTK